MKKITLLLALMLSGLGFAQSNNLNDYKYIVIPEQFEFLKEKNQYNMNGLVKMIFEKKGFQVFYVNEELPFEAKMDRCKVLYGDLLNDSSLLSTTLTIVLKDCGEKVVFTSLEGKSREKEYRKAYYEALREASRSVDATPYEYKENSSKALQEAPSGVQIALTPEARSTQENQLFAKPTAYGYELIDNTQKSVLKMYKTSQADSYSAKMEEVNGVVFKKDGEWFFEYYLDDKPVSQKLNIKF